MMTENPSEKTGAHRIRQIKETCIYAVDLDKMREFYAGKLGLEVLSSVTGKHIFSGQATLFYCALTPRTRDEK